LLYLVTLSIPGSPSKIMLITEISNLVRTTHVYAIKSCYNYYLTYVI
jgi:hypothetical protein